MTFAQALDRFWKSFGIPAYEENTDLGKITPPITFPYITYQRVMGSFDYPVVMTASLWDKDKGSYSADLHNIIKADEIVDRLKGGYWQDDILRITTGSPEYQSMGDTDKTIHRVVFNITAEYMR